MGWIELNLGLNLLGWAKGFQLGLVSVDSEIAKDGDTAGGCGHNSTLAKGLEAENGILWCGLHPSPIHACISWILRYF